MPCLPLALVVCMFDDTVLYGRDEAKLIYNAQHCSGKIGKAAGGIEYVGDTGGKTCLVMSQAGDYVCLRNTMAPKAKKS